VWCSDANARSRCVLASSAIHRRFVDRFVGLRVPSRVSRRWVSPRGAPLPSGGSRQARFPALVGSTKALRLPASALPVPYDFGLGLHAFLRLRARRGAPGAAENRVRAWGALVRRSLPVSGWLRMDRRGISQVSWQSIPYLCPALRPRSDRGDLAACGPSSAAPGPNTPKAPTEHDLEAQPRASVSAAYASRTALPPPMQGSLPAGGLRLCREGVEPSGSLRKVSGYIRPPFQDFPDASWVHMRRGFFQFHASTQSPLAAEVLARVAALYAIEAEIRGQSAEHRLRVRRERSKPIVEALHEWLHAHIGRVSGASDLAIAMRYAIRHWPGLTAFLDDGRIEMGRVDDWRGGSRSRRYPLSGGFRLCRCLIRSGRSSVSSRRSSNRTCRFPASGFLPSHQTFDLGRSTRRRGTR
jgi:hypothetical protein